MTRYAIIILLLLSVSAFSVDINDANKYVLLIKDVHNYYKTSCIIIVCSNSHTSKSCSLFSKIVCAKVVDLTVSRIN